MNEVCSQKGEAAAQEQLDVNWPQVKSQDNHQMNAVSKTP